MILSSWVGTSVEWWETKGIFQRPVVGGNMDGMGVIPFPWWRFCWRYPLWDIYFAVMVAAAILGLWRGRGWVFSSGTM